MIRCCLCREQDTHLDDAGGLYLIRTDLPGSGYRCRDREACKLRVAGIIQAHLALVAIFDDVR